MLYIILPNFTKKPNIAKTYYFFKDYESVLQRNTLDIFLPSFYHII
jgi:hypothetical protein